MNKIPIIVFVALSVSPPFVCAQSSVTIYGIIDLGVSYISNSSGSTVYKMRSGAWTGSRLGFRGVEDLGGGYKSVFVLENGFDATSGKLGQNGRMFGRTSYVGVETPYGTMTLGRQYDPVVDFTGNILANGRGTSPIYDLDNTGNDYQTNNSVKFRSRSFGGFSASALYSFGGTPGQFSQNSAFGVGAGYADDKLEIGVAYTSVRNPYANWYDSTGASSISIYGAYLPTARDLNITAVGAAYKFGRLIARGGMTRSVLVDGITHSQAQFNTYVAQADFWMTPALRLSAATDFTDASIGVSSKHPKYRQYNLVAAYFLSKRTNLYAWGIYGTAGSGATQDQIGQLTASTTTRQANIQVGIQHRF